MTRRESSTTWVRILPTCLDRSSGEQQQVLQRAAAIWRRKWDHQGQASRHSQSSCVEVKRSQDIDISAGEEVW